MCALAFSSVAVSRTAIPSRASEARQRPPEAEEARDEKRFLRFGFSPGAWAIRAPSPWPALAVAAAWGSRQVKSRRRLSFGLSLALVPTAARAEEGLKQIGNEIFSVQLPQGFIWNEKFILAKTHLFEQSVGASDPYGKWKVGLTIDEVFANSLSDVGSVNAVADRIADIERQKDGNFTTDVLSAKEVAAGEVPTYLIEYRCDTSRGFNHFLVRVALKKGRLYTLTSQAPEDQWKKLEDATRESFDSFRLTG